MTNIAIMGEFGSGKTMAMTWILYRNYLGINPINTPRPIYSNYTLGFEHTRVNNIEEFDDIKFGVVGMDEFWFWLDSRLAMKRKAIEMSRILSKGRKRGVDLIYTVQFFGQMDKRMREFTDEIILPKYNHYRKNIVFEHFTGVSGTLDKYNTLTKALSGVQSEIRVIPADEVKRIGELYDTTEEINAIE